MYTAVSYYKTPSAPPLFSTFVSKYEPLQAPWSSFYDLDLTFSNTGLLLLERI